VSRYASRAVRLAVDLVLQCRAEKTTAQESLSFGGPDFLVLVALTPRRIAEVQALIPKLEGVAGDPVIDALRAQVAELMAENAVLRGEVT
jgi:hypothetical protein